MKNTNFESIDSEIDKLLYSEEEEKKIIEDYKLLKKAKRKMSPAKKKFILVGTMVVIAGVATGLIFLKHGKKEITTTSIDDVLDDADLTDEQAIRTTLFEKIEQYYNKHDSNYSLEEVLAFIVITNNMKPEEIEDIFNGEWYSSEDMKASIANFYNKSFVNYTYATEKSGLEVFINDENEKKMFSKLESAMIALNKNVDEESVDNLNSLLKKLLSEDNNYSDGLKRYGILSIYPTFIHLTANSKYSSQKRIDKFESLKDQLCDLFSGLEKNRDAALVIHGEELAADIDAYLEKETAFSNLSKQIKSLSSYNPVDVKDLTARDVVSKEELESSKAKDSSSSPSVKKGDGKEVEYNDLTDKEKKEVKEDKTKIKEDLTDENLFKASVAEDGKILSEIFLNDVTNYVEERVTKSGIADDYSISYIKNTILDNNLSDFIGKFKEDYSIFYSDTSSKEYKKAKKYYASKMEYYLKNTYKITIEVNGKDTTALAWAIKNGVTSGLTKYAVEHQGISADPTVTPGVVIKPDAKSAEEAAKNDNSGNNTNYYDDTQSDYWTEGWIGDNPNNGVTNPNNSDDTTNNSTTGTTNQNTTSNQQAPVLDLTGDQTTYIYTR
jgi:hypothetical protein